MQHQLTDRKTICQREVPREQVIKLIETGKTDLLTRFISKKGKPFSAFLKLEGDRVGFEFEKRKPAAKKPAAKAPTTQAAA
jgi:DNA topoisomerase-3